MFTDSCFKDRLESARVALSGRLRTQVLFNEPLAKYLAYQVGGPADILVFPEREEDLVAISEVAKAKRLPITIIGQGTNLLVVDEGIRGITVSLSRAFQAIERRDNPDSDSTKSWVRVGGGVTKPDFLNWAIEKSLSGLEFSAGVPGTIGGGIFMNAGTKYGCYGDILKELRLFDFASGAQQLTREQAEFGYREQTAVKGSLVLWATFELTPGNSKAIQAEVDRIIAERAEKQPLDYPSCGSTFKNPPEGLSAGRLIERTGLKGMTVGGAQISEKHANFILNKGGASARDILSLIDTVKSRVLETTGVSLDCEVIILGNS